MTGKPFELMVMPANLDHSHDVWRWRNDALTRRMSRSGEPVSWKAHQDWFSRCLQDERRHLYIGSLSNCSENVGMCRFDADESAATAVVSLNLCSRARGKGLGGMLLSMSIQALDKDVSRTLYATIRKSNISSVRCFSACGFQPVSCDKGFMLYVRTETRHAVSRDRESGA